MASLFKTRFIYNHTEEPCLQAVELSQRTQAAVQIVSNLPAPSNGGPIYRFFGHAGHADPLDGWRCCSQKAGDVETNPGSTTLSKKSLDL